MTQVIGSRVAGTENEIKARDYIERTLSSFGYDVSIQEFTFDRSRYRPAQIDLGDTTVEGVSFRGSADGSATGAIVAAGIGRPEEFPAGGLGGAIALIERGTLTFVEKAQNATAAGASAVIIYNNISGPLVGNTPDVTMPVLAISREDGQMIADRLAAGPLQATVTVVPPQSTAYNVIAKPHGATSCRTVSGGHYDSVPGVEAADDNASGTAAVLELARVAAANALPGANCFVLFSAEEFGLFGSGEFVDELPDGELNALRAMVNLDVVGTDAGLTLIGDADMTELARVEAQREGIEASLGEIPANSSSDHASFQRAGVPVVFFYRHDELIHTEQDAIGRIRPESIEETIRVAYAVLRALNGE